MSSVCTLCKTNAIFLFNIKDHNEKITDQILHTESARIAN